MKSKPIILVFSFDKMPRGHLFPLSPSSKSLTDSPKCATVYWIAKTVEATKLVAPQATAFGAARSVSLVKTRNASLPAQFAMEETTAAMKRTNPTALSKKIVLKSTPSFDYIVIFRYFLS